MLVHTDLTLSADYYHYTQDATQAAYASLIFNGRGGAGVPVAPLQYLIRPEVAHRFGEDAADVGHHDLFVVLGLVTLGDEARPRELAVGRVRKTDRERLHARSCGRCRLRG